MSGDAQPRKRRDKRRRKGQVEARRAEEYAEEREILHQLSTQSEPEEEELYPNLKDTDEVIHIHKDAHTGGNIVTKIIFFLLMGGLAVMIGLILLEHRGTTDDDHEASVKETPWSLQFEDWSKLVAVPEIVPEFFKGEQADHDHHASHSGEETDDHGGEHDEHDEEHDDHDEGHDEPVADSADSGWLPSFGLGGWGGSTDDVEASEPEEVSEPEASSSWFGFDYFSGGEEKPEEPVEEEEAPESKEIEGAELSEEEEVPDDEETPEEEDQDDGKDEDDLSGEDQDEEEDNLSVERDLDEEEPPSREQFDEDDEPDRSAIDDEIPQSEEIEQDETVSGEGEDDDDPRGSMFPRRSSIIEEEEEEEEEAEEEAAAASSKFEEEEEEEPAALPETSEEELFPEAVAALQREALELLREQREAEEKEAAAVESIKETLEDETDEATETGDEETEGMALKFGVGVALVVVAHVVLVKKWNSWAVEQEAQTQASSPVSSPTVQISPPTPPSPKPTPEPPLAAWAEEAIKAAEAPSVGRTPPRTPTPDLGDEYEGESETGEEEEEEEEEELSEDEPPINPKIYEELIAKYGKPTPESSDAEASDDGHREYSDGAEVESVGEEESGGELEESEPEEEEQRWTSTRKPVDVETESEGEEEEESEDEPPPTRKPPQGGGRSENEATSPTEEELLRRQLELADDEFNMEHFDSALVSYRRVLTGDPKYFQALFGVARTLDRLAEAKRSNALLQEAIDAYLNLLAVEQLPDDIFVSAAQRAINRLRFRGLHMKAVGVHKQLIERFNDTVEYRNDLAINYLMVNRLSDAERIFLDTLSIWPDDPVARSHYGLVLKLGGKAEESIPHLLRGLAHDHPGTRDSRLYFHLGDALSRSGRTDEAMQTYQRGVDKGLFRSVHQRSLYNIEHLTARPWWTHKQTTYEEFFKTLESNWKVIRDEGLSAMKLGGMYQDEAENLRDVGDWKQFQLFGRGAMNAENCKKVPVTCKIIANFAPARGCKRGQSKFSVMEGGTHVWPHCGPTNCRLRAHLGLIVPPGPAIRVAGETRKWIEGKVMVFDDSFEHEVWHNGTSLRLVLIVDVWHPGLSSAEKASLSPI